MDDDIKILLKEIASELRERNDLTRAMSARSEERLKEVDAKREQLGLDGSRENRLKKTMEQSEERLTRFRQDAELRNAERKDFQQALLTEFRRMNSSLEALINK
jgi:hypothetical protein